MDLKYHIPVLLGPGIEGLNIMPNGTYVDLTFGGGGHSKAILKRLEKGKLIVFDQDEDAWANRIDDDRVLFVRHNFRFLYHFLNYLNLMPVDGIIADLGVSSHHFDEASRGFSFRFDGDLDMRMNRDIQLNAATVLNTYSVDELTRVFKIYGEVPSAYRLANDVVNYRLSGLFRTTNDLKNIASRYAPLRDASRYYSQVFQALRIEVNGEIDALKEMLVVTPDVIKPGGRLVIISYHSLEDRMVKNFIKTGNVHKSEIETDLYGRYKVPFSAINRKVIVPADDEIEKNPRARSARLRVAERT